MITLMATADKLRLTTSSAATIDVQASITSNISAVLLSGDVTNNNAVANTMQDVPTDELRSTNEVAHYIDGYHRTQDTNGARHDCREANRKNMRTDRKNQ